MKLKIVLAVATVAIVAFPLAATAGSGRDRVTGGGQILFSMQGAGNTVAFTAQQLVSGGSTDARGEVQIVNRELNTKEHGRVFCVVAEQMGNFGVAELAYANRDNPSDIDQLYVVDRGEGAAAQDDIVFIDEEPQSTCDLNTSDDDDGSTALGRGNAQVYDGD